MRRGRRVVAITLSYTHFIEPMVNQIFGICWIGKNRCFYPCVTAALGGSDGAGWPGVAGVPE
jgi:hypothetical protein